MKNLKSFDTALYRNFVDNEPVDVAPQMAVENAFEEFVDFTFFTLNLKEDPAVDKVLHPSDHIVPGRNGFN
jgi:hypothetical protein